MNRLTHAYGRYCERGQESLAAAAPLSRPALFLDRDGVINMDFGYVHRPSDTTWVPGIFELCRMARASGYLLVVVTNQAGIARGLYSEAQFLDYTRWLHECFNEQGVPLAATYYCPHHPTAGIGALRVDCDCRKPGAAMLLAAIEDFGIDPGRSVLVGDKASDIQAGQAAGIGHLVRVAAGDLSGVEQRFRSIASGQ